MITKTMTRQEIINGLLYDLSPQSLTKKENELIDFAIKELSKQPETLSRRDEIASRAMQGLLANPELLKGDNTNLNIENTAILFADALIKELNKGESQDLK